ncbi:MAG: leucine-rich repeat domain-containing protein [Kiritimatiellae bacterium]|nr:leucine-rich repeat domain-containing protein [Kiritimatiellia bacterium]
MTVEEGVWRIGDAAFFGCTNLESVAFPDSLTSIRPCAFGDCVRLRRVWCGTGLAEVGQAAFGGCKNLQNIYFNGDAPKQLGTRILVRTPATLVNHVRSGAKGWGVRWPANDDFSRPVAVVEPQALTNLWKETLRR